MTRTKPFFTGVAGESCCNTRIDPCSKYLKRDVIRLTQIYTALQAQLVEARFGAVSEGGMLRQIDVDTYERAHVPGPPRYSFSTYAEEHSISDAVSRAAYGVPLLRAASSCAIR